MIKKNTIVANKIKSSIVVKSLNGKWDLRHERIGFPKAKVAQILKSKADWIETPIPGDIHQGLIDAGLVEEPSIGLNAKKTLWTRNKSWWLKKNFSLTDADINKSQRIELVLNGLDCNAWIFINGILVGEHGSAFRPFVKNIKSQAKPGNNTVLVRLTDGLDQVTDNDLKQLQGYIPVDAVRPERGQPKRVFVRKAQYSWGWDWSPESSTTGITGDACIRVINSDFIEDVAVRAAGSCKTAILAITVKTQRANSFRACPAKLEVKIKDSQGKLVASRIKKCILQSGTSFTSFDIPVTNPQLWWPNGAGKQPLYRVEAGISGPEILPDTFERNFGIRFAEIDTDNNMCVKINGKEMFSKGANFIPADMFYARTDGKTYRKLVEEARNANFNMLRIWGGGIYLPEEFYQACDEYGIMLWHDFMFACAPYPDYLKSFAEEIRQEVDYQLRRLRNHPSIVLWCGGNENIWARAQSENKDNGAVIAGKILPEAVNHICPDIPYFYSSPYGDKENRCHVSNTGSGDCHCWDDTMMCPDMSRRIDFRNYDKIQARFISEYGFPGTCGKDTIRNYLGTNDRVNSNSSAWKYHYNTFAENTIEQAITKHYADYQDLSLDDFLYYSGIVQGRVYGYSLESFRQRTDCHGGLFWMYNDCWGEVGWSIIDYYLRRKVSYWFVKRALAPRKLIIRPVSKNKLRVTAVNDSQEKISLKVKAGWLDFSDRKEKHTIEKQISVPAFGLNSFEFDQHQLDQRSGLWMTQAVTLDTGFEPTVFCAADFRSLARKSGTIDVRVVAKHGQTWVLELSSSEFTHAVELNVPKGAQPDDNYFDLYPGLTKKVSVAGIKKMPKKLILRSI